MSLHDIFFREVKSVRNKMRSYHADPVKVKNTEFFDADIRNEAEREIVQSRLVIEGYEHVMDLTSIHQDTGIMAAEEACQDIFGADDPRSILVSLMADGYDDRDKILEMGMNFYDENAAVGERLAYLIFLKGLVEYTGENNCIHPLNIMLQSMMPDNIRKYLPEYERIRREDKEAEEKKIEAERKTSGYYDQIHTVSPELEEVLAWT